MWRGGARAESREGGEKRQERQPRAAGRHPTGRHVPPVLPTAARACGFFLGSRGWMPFRMHSRRNSDSLSCSFFSAWLRDRYCTALPDWPCGRHKHKSRQASVGEGVQPRAPTARQASAAQAARAEACTRVRRPSRCRRRLRSAAGSAHMPRCELCHIACMLRGLLGPPEATWGPATTLGESRPPAALRTFFFFSMAAVPGHSASWGACRGCRLSCEHRRRLARRVPGAVGLSGAVRPLSIGHYNRSHRIAHARRPFGALTAGTARTACMFRPRSHRPPCSQVRRLQHFRSPARHIERAGRTFASVTETSAEHLRACSDGGRARRAPARSK